MLKIRRPLGRLIFNMGIVIPGKTVFLIETAPWSGDVNSRANKTKRLRIYNDAIMSTMAPQITSHTIDYSTVYSGADQRKHQSSASPAFVVNSPHKGSVTRKCFHLMTSSEYWLELGSCEHKYIFLLFHKEWGHKLLKHAVVGHIKKGQ